MKIEDKHDLRGVSAVSGRAATHAVGPAVVTASRPVEDSASVMGIPEAELTPKVRDAIMSLMREVDELRRELHRHQARLADLERLADQDALVPLHNRRAFVRELARVMSFTQRYGGTASMIYFDLDGLKTINDSLGHAAGDGAIRQVAETLLANVRDSDIVGRLGGDEFGIILAQADEKRAVEKAEGLAIAIRNQPLQWEGKTVPLAIAFGVCALKPGADPSAALAAADRAMYLHKAKAKAQAQAQAEVKYKANA